MMLREAVDAAERAMVVVDSGESIL
jgi:hypothetical protein